MGDLEPRDIFLAGSRSNQLMLAVLLGLGCCADALASGTVTNGNLAGLNAALAGGGNVLCAFDGTITLTNTITISQDTTLDGSAHQVRLVGNKMFRLFNVNSNVSLTLLNLVLADGLSQGTQFPAVNDPVGIGYGGCIANNGGNLTLSNCVLTGNTAIGGLAMGFYNAGWPAYGGAIYSSSGNLVLNRTIINQGRAQGGDGLKAPGGSAYGGAVYALGGSVTLISCTIASNQVTGGQDQDLHLSLAGATFGGAIYVSNVSLSITNSTFQGNHATTVDNKAGLANLSGGGALYLQASTSYVSATAFLSNVAAGNSGTNLSSVFNPAIGSNGADGHVSGGGAVFSDGWLTVTQCLFSANSMHGNSTSDSAVPAPGSGGAVFNAGDAWIANSTFSSNTASGGDGMGGNWGGIPGNSGVGGAVYNSGRLTLLNSTLQNNSALGGVPSPGATPGNGFGGALYDSGTTFATNNTFFGNYATNDAYVYWKGGPGFGGAIFASNARTLLVNNTLAANDVNSSGICGGIFVTNSDVTVKNSILANNSGNCAGALIDGGHNLSSDDTCHFTAPGSRNGIAPLLTPLRDNGGPTVTLLPLLDSPAVDAGDPTNCPATDQRGFPRPQRGGCDIGAVELGPDAISGHLHSLWQFSNVVVTVAGVSRPVGLDGGYSFEVSAPGTYLVTLSAPGLVFDPVSQPVTVGSTNRSTDFNAYLRNSLSITPRTNGTVGLTYAGVYGQALEVERSTNLASWTFISFNLVGTNNLFTITDTNSLNASSRFYRAKTP